MRQKRRSPLERRASFVDGSAYLWERASALTTVVRMARIVRDA